MKAFILAVCLLALIEFSYAKERTEAEKKIFKEWRETHKKEYKTLVLEAEALEKLLINWEKIQAHNKLHDEGKVTFRMGLSEHSDLSDDERIQKMTGFLKRPKKEFTRIAREANYPQFPKTTETSVNWTAQGLDSPVENQKQCSVCWAFSATYVVNNLMLKRNMSIQGRLASQQQLVDCQTSNREPGCFGGYPDSGLIYVKENGITDEKTYPYIQDGSGSCKYKKSDSIMNISAVYNIPTNGESMKVLSIRRFINVFNR